MDKEYVQERDCTSKCRSSVHAKQILNCAAASTSSQIRAYSVWLCHNFSAITDEFGRNLLHVASACGKWEIVEWLLKYCNVDVDIKDSESGWTALHRSLFYGQLVSARVLFMHGASLRATDHEGFTPLDIIMKDRLPYIEYLPTHPSEVYAWGSNDNYNLGNLLSRKDPEIFEVFRKDSINIKQVVICKFHSVFLSTNGKVYTCGYGHGGRLGQGNEDISLVPSLVRNIDHCTQIAAGQDHLLLLLEGGQVWSCGLNTYHQLGLIPPVERTLIPKPLSLKFLKKEIIGIHAARFHSVMYTKDSVYTFGLNAGQLGHPRGDRTQIQPRQVSTLYNEDWYITHVEVSDGATVCATSRGDVYVLHEYQIRKIASRQLEILKISVVGGNLDSRCDVAGVKEKGGLELRVMLLTKSGKVYLWRQSDPYLRRCLFMLQKELIIADIHINHHSIGLITNDSEGYIGNIIPFKRERPPPPSTTLPSPTIFSSQKSSGLTVLLNTDDCNFIKVKKLPNVYRGTSITSDSKGRNFAILQSSPKMGLVELPLISESQMQQDFSKFFSETCIGDDFHDVIIKVEKREFAAHKYILAYRSDYFREQFLSDGYEGTMLKIEGIRPEAFEQVLKFIYCNRCDFLTSGYEVTWEAKGETGKKKKSGAKNSKSVSPLVQVEEACRKLGVTILVKLLKSVRLVNGKITVLETNAVPKLMFNRHFSSKLSDVNLLSSDGCVFQCHKCILVSRLDYFHSMLNTFWAENSQLGELSLPIPSQVMEVILDYIYADKSNRILDAEDVEFLCTVLMIADQLLMQQLKELCEMSLAELITLKNAAELLELSSVYNAAQLKKTCMQFISINLPAIIEAKSLEVLSNEVIEDLSSYYRSLIPSMHKRKISCCGPSQEILAYVEKNFPVSSTSSYIKNRVDYHESKRSRRRCNSAHIEEKVVSTNRSKNNSECSEKDIVLNIVLPEDEKEDTDSCELKLENKVNILQESMEKMSVESPGDKPMQQVLKCPNLDQFPVLDKITFQEQQKFMVLQKKSNMKPMPHLSQKQKKMNETVQEKNSESPVLNITPSKVSCPWAKLPEQSPPSPSFWDAYAKKEFQPSTISREVKNTDICTKNPDVHACNTSGFMLDIIQDKVMSLDDIQKAEEQKLCRAVNPKIKSLDILNIEDQAIEELIAMYNADNNPKEKITVSRVMPEEIASPVWKKHG